MCVGVCGGGRDSRKKEREIEKEREVEGEREGTIIVTNDVSSADCKHRTTLRLRKSQAQEPLNNRKEQQGCHAAAAAAAAAAERGRAQGNGGGKSISEDNCS